ncbi:MAG: serine/threonine-protein kinase, partial [Planctomycetota bacterium]
MTDRDDPIDQDPETRPPDKSLGSDETIREGSIEARRITESEDRAVSPPSLHDDRQTRELDQASADPEMQQTLDLDLSADSALIADGVNDGPQVSPAMGLSSPTGEPISPDDQVTLLPGQWPVQESGKDPSQPSKEGSVATNWDAEEEGHSAAGRARTRRDSAADTATIEIPAEFSGSMDQSQTGSGGDPTLPKYVGKFRVVRELGRGAFGVVYLARDELLNRRVAIKLSLVDDASYQDRLLVEASNVSKVEDDHIVPVYQVDRTEFGAVYVVQKYIDGVTLSGLIGSEPAATPGQAINLINTLASGLRTPHEQGMLHRDLKPDNILLDVDGKPWIVDFGLAILEKDQVGAARQLAGTPPYMSPEQIQGRIDFMDARSDIWSLGIIFYEMLCGTLPFRGKSREDLTQQICSRDPKPLHQRDSKRLTEQMDQFFRSCCAKEPQDRFATVDQLSAAISELARQYVTDWDLEHPLGLNPDRSTRVPVSSRNTEFPTRVTDEGSLLQNRTRVDSVAVPAGGVGGYLKHLVSVAVIAAVVAAAFVARDWTRPTGTVSTPSDPSSIQANAGPAGSLSETNANLPTGALEAHDFAGPSEDNVGAPGDETNGTAANRTAANRDPELSPFDPSADSPRTVALSGIANHRTIQDALDSAEPDELILVADGFYDESLVIRKPIRLKSADEDSRPQIRGDGRAVLTTDCEGGSVTIEGFVISATDRYDDGT